ncbi:MAG: hypothetical protein U1E02_06185, partial [Hydrogenophaga sp.]|nr:hypothetical protein [Hydrogenophaga sp.]
AGGHGIMCSATAKNMLITNSFVTKTGNGGNGYRGSPPSSVYPGYAGSGGNGFQFDNNSQTIQIKECRIEILGVAGTGYTTGSPSTNGKLINCPTNSLSLIFSCADLPAPKNIYYFEKI